MCHPLIQETRFLFGQGRSFSRISDWSLSFGNNIITSRCEQDRINFTFWSYLYTFIFQVQHLTHPCMHARTRTHFQINLLQLEPSA